MASTRNALTVLVAAGIGACTYLALHAQEANEGRSSKFFQESAAPLTGADAAPELAPGRSLSKSQYYSTVPRDIASLQADNKRLRLMLQQMELDRLRAVHNAIPAEEANALRDSIWHSPIIEVSWENPEAAPAAELDWVRDAVRNTWEAESGLQFTGWQKATANSRGIRIRIEDSGPHCKRLGNRLDGLRDGMVLNFTFRNWCPQCAGAQGASREHAIRAIAVHEFGHAIGFAHEQNRSDAPGWCQEQRQGSDGDWYITIYDPESIMNYCSTEWNNAGRLSEYDKIAIQTIYGPPHSAEPAPTSLPSEDSISR